MARFIGISGKPGSNKLFYAFRIMRELKVRGCKTVWSNLAIPLYEEFNTIADRFISGESEGVLSQEFNLGEKSPEFFEILSRGLGEKNPAYGYSRRNASVRQGLVMLGSGIRREQDPNYFIEKLVKNTGDAKFGVITDLRYPNEADWIRHGGGLNIRLEQVDPTDFYGGYKYNEGAADPSERSLDDYPFFDHLFIREIFDGRAFGFELEDFFDLSEFEETVR